MPKRTTRKPNIKIWSKDEMKEVILSVGDLPDDSEFSRYETKQKSKESKK